MNALHGSNGLYKRIQEAFNHSCSFLLIYQFSPRSNPRTFSDAQRQVWVGLYPLIDGVVRLFPFLYRYAHYEPCFTTRSLVHTALPLRGHLFVSTLLFSFQALKLVMPCFLFAERFLFDQCSRDECSFSLSYHATPVSGPINSPNSLCFPSFPHTSALERILVV